MRSARREWWRKRWSTPAYCLAVGSLVAAAMWIGGDRDSALTSFAIFVPHPRAAPAGLRLDEVGALLDEDGVSLLDTVRRHLEQVEHQLDKQQRLRQRLRALLNTLERSLEPSIDQFIETLAAMTVVEAKVKDVLVWHSHIGDPPSEQPLPHAPRTGQHAVLLEEHGGERVLPMWIGQAEAHGLTLGLSGRSESRPLTWDLTARLLQAGGLRLERVVVEGIRDLTFYATVVLRSDGQSHEIDAVPSDAFNHGWLAGGLAFGAFALWLFQFGDAALDRFDLIGLDAGGGGDLRGGGLPTQLTDQSALGAGDPVGTLDKMHGEADRRGARRRIIRRRVWHRALGAGQDAPRDYFAYREQSRSFDVRMPVSQRDAKGGCAAAAGSCRRGTHNGRRPRIAPATISRLG